MCSLNTDIQGRIHDFHSGGGGGGTKDDQKQASPIRHWTLINLV